MNRSGRLFTKWKSERGGRRWSRHDSKTVKSWIQRANINLKRRASLGIFPRTVHDQPAQTAEGRDIQSRHSCTGVISNQNHSLKQHSIKSFLRTDTSREDYYGPWGMKTHPDWPLTCCTHTHTRARTHAHTHSTCDQVFSNPAELHEKRLAPLGCSRMSGSSQWHVSTDSSHL